MPPVHPTQARANAPQRPGLKNWPGRLGPASRLFIIFILYLALRWWLLGSTAPAHFSDTPSYVEQYRGGFASGFFGRVRSWGYPFVIWLAGHRLGLVVAAQRLAGALAWFTLAWAATGLFRHAAARRIAFWGTLLISLTLFSLIWDVMLLSESLSNSLFIALTTAWIRFLGSKAAGFQPLALMAMLALPFAGLRDSNGLLLPLYGGCVALVLAARFFRGPEPRPPRRAFWSALGLTGLLLLICLTHIYEMRRCRRNWQSVGAVFSKCIYMKSFGGLVIPDEENIDWLARRYDLPAAEARARIGKTTYQPPPLAPVYEAWLKQTGPRALLGFMAHHPQWVLDTFNANAFYGMTEAGMFYLQPPDPWRKAHLKLPFIVQTAIHKTLDRPLNMPWGNTLLTLATTALGLAWLVRAWRHGLDGLGRRLGSLFWLTAMSAAMAFIATFGDFHEPWRHAITGLLAFYAAVPITAAAVIDKFARFPSGAEKTVSKQV